ncbi:hypothetical protein ZHAS_00004721 [Anopheles sinensis]|uniref:Uncharacterized protein n=1 Tax=Anopheles sinensis TaxID=74873 RepID=A0A084VHQ5_ANOSI|nr:hypothetical protein ZHAS_00004721 [Anopheles sinensis]
MLNITECWEEKNKKKAFIIVAIVARTDNNNNNAGQCPEFNSMHNATARGPMCHPAGSGGDTYLPEDATDYDGVL